MIRAMAALVAVLLLATPAAGREQPLPECSFLEDWQLPPLPGQLAVAQRVFAPPTDGGSAVATFNPNVAEFATADRAAAAFPVLVERLQGSVIGDVREGVGTGILDESVVFACQGCRDGTTSDVAQVLFRDGRYVHSWQGSAVGADPVPLMLDVVGRLLARRQQPAGTPAPVAAPDLPRLFEQLPEAGDVPNGFELVRQGCGVRRTTGGPPATPSGEAATPQAR